MPQSKVAHTIVIVLAVIGAIAIISVLVMLLSHGWMMGSRPM